MQKTEEPLDVLVVGAGQAGLALGYYLQKQAKSFLIVDAASQVGQSWRDRYDSLRLFTPAEYCQLPGLSLSLPKGYYPGKDEIADYLQGYAAHFNLPISLSQQVTSLTKKEGLFLIKTKTGQFSARQVVVATGPFQTPFIPSYSGTLVKQVVQLHSAHYRNPAQIPPGKVLVVGAGNSGAQIAIELSKSHLVHLSVKKKPRFSSLRLLGKSVFWWATKTGAIYRSASSRLGRKIMKQGDLIYGRELEQLLQGKEIKLHPEISSFNENQVLFQDGQAEAFSCIIWATGFKPTFNWINVPDAISADGRPVHSQGISPVRGLFFLGLPWQRSRSSALLLGAGRDALFIAQHLT